ncbi:MAG: outer membrane protein transport protein [Verrucomicrobia bacterium]|nr:outer membrane protein transport protein [Verrucomicrobiota bacterium]
MNSRSVVGSKFVAVFVGLVVVFFVAASIAQANGFRNPPGGAAAAGTDGGKIAFIDDASAVSHNPANLTEIDQSAAMVSLTFIDGKAEFDSAFGPSAETDNGIIILPNVYAVFPGEEGSGLSYGVGITTPFGQSTTWEKDSFFKGIAPYFAEIQVIDVMPSVAVKITDDLSVGGGFDIYQSEINIRSIVPWSVALGLPLPDGSLRLEGDGVGYGGNVGVTWKVAENQRLAAAYHAGFSIDYDGNADLTGAPAGIGTVPKSDFDTQIDFPAMATIGYGIQLSEKVQVGVDVEWVEFSDYESLLVGLGANDIAGLFPAETPQDWDDIWTAGIAGSWQVSDELVLRASYKFLESPIPDDTHAPTLPDADKHLVAVGAGWNSGGHTLDVAFTHSIFDDRNVTDNQNPAYNGEYDLSSELLSVAYSVSF